MDGRLKKIEAIHAYIIKNNGSLFNVDAEGSPQEVSLSNIRNAIIDLKYIDRINSQIFPSENGVLKGMFKRCQFNDGKQEEARIYYKKSLLYKDYRFVLCKELSHIFDTEEERAHDQKALMEIVGYAVSNIEQASSKPTHSEQKAVLCAIELLIPFSWRESFLKNNPDRRKIDYKKQSNRLGVPVNQLIQSLSTDYMEYIQNIKKLG